MIIENTLIKILDKLNEGIYILNKERRIVYWNRAAESITGFKVEEVIGKSCSENILRHIDENGNELCRGDCPMSKILNGQNRIEAVVFLHHKMGYRLPVKIIGVNMVDKKGKVFGIEIFYPFIEGSLIEKSNIVKAALFDELTLALNRYGLETFFHLRLEESLILDKKAAIVFIDVDDFKKINDKYGHDMGDKVLYNFSMTIKSTLRDKDLFCRWGGEEFVLILFLEKVENLLRISERIRMLINNSFISTGKDIIKYTASFGVTLFKKEESLIEAINRADRLMYISKTNGKNLITHDLNL